MFSYLEFPLAWSDEDKRFNGPSNTWESREIARIFAELGFIVEAINWADYEFVPRKEYDVLFDIHTNMQRLAPLLGRSVLKILYCTGSDAYYQNRAEMQRVRDLETRRNMLYAPKRMVAHPDLARKSLEVADVCALLGNDHTLSTYPTEFRHKFRLLRVSGSVTGQFAKSPTEYLPEHKEFLWFSGGGAVHKGLDLVLEAFSRNPQSRLNIVGPLDNELDFWRIYHRELKECKNIRYHGYLRPDGQTFRQIANRSFCFIAPSCSEGMSTSVVTCMQVGLYPVISRDCGVSLPEGCGIYLEECTLEEIEHAIHVVLQMPTDDLIDQMLRIQTYAKTHFSRESFRSHVENFIRDTLNEHGL